jgi:hypothetical protein
MAAAMAVAGSADDAVAATEAEVEPDAGRATARMFSRRVMRLVVVCVIRAVGGDWGWGGQYLIDRYI